PKAGAPFRTTTPLCNRTANNEKPNRVHEAAADFKKAILTAVAKNTRRETDPPFIPMALYYEEEIHDPITETRVGSYWDLVANYIIGSRIFAGSERELWLPRYFEQHGGLCMG